MNNELNERLLVNLFGCTKGEPYEADWYWPIGTNPYDSKDIKRKIAVRNIPDYSGTGDGMLLVLAAIRGQSFTVRHRFAEAMLKGI